MPRFFFNVRDGITLSDDTGLELASLKDAQVLAVRRAATLLQENEVFWHGEEWAMDVLNEAGRKLFTLSFSVHDLDGLLKVKADPPSIR